MRNRLIKLVTFLSGLYFVIEFLFPKGSITTPLQHGQVTDGYIAVGSAALFLGLISLFIVHGGRLLFLRRGWGASLALLIGVFWMFLLAGAEWYASEQVARRVRPVTLLSEFSRRIADDEVRRQGQDGHTELSQIMPLRERLGALVRAVAELSEQAELFEQAKSSEQAKLDSQDALKSQLANPQGSVSAIQQVLAANQALAGAMALATEGSSTDGATDGQADALTNTPLSLPNFQQVSAPLNALADALDGLAVKMDEQAREDYKNGGVKRWYDFTVQGVFSPLSSSMFSLLAFFMAAAAFRAFRVRNIEAALMVAAASLVILGQTPFGVRLIEFLPALRLWLLEVPNSAAFRAIAIGSSVAALVLAFRMWLSLDRDEGADATPEGSSDGGDYPNKMGLGRGGRN